MTLVNARKWEAVCRTNDDRVPVRGDKQRCTQYAESTHQMMRMATRDTSPSSLREVVLPVLIKSSRIFARPENSRKRT
jgi:hypothetical protein